MNNIIDNAIRKCHDTFDVDGCNTDISIQERNLIMNIIIKYAQGEEEDEKLLENICVNFFKTVAIGTLRTHLDSKVRAVPIRYCSRCTVFFLDLVEKTQSNMILLKKVCSPIFRGLTKAMDEITILNENFISPLRVLKDIISIPIISHIFVTCENFICCILNLTEFDKESIFSAFFKSACSKTIPGAVEHYFENCSNITSVEKEFLFKLVRAKLKSTHEILCEIFTIMHKDSFLNSALLTWIACVSHSRAIYRKSQLFLLLSLGTVMLEFGVKNQVFQFDELNDIDASYMYSPTVRMNLFQQTKINFTEKAFLEWYERSRTSTDVKTSSSSVSDIAYFEQSLLQNHGKMVCDSCRIPGFSGIRYKCSNCEDFDLCEKCENQTYIDLVTKDEVIPVVQFSCPLCIEMGLSEPQLRKHIEDTHFNHVGILSCTICTANGLAQPEYTIQGLIKHFKDAHSSNHDPHTHIMMKVKYMIPLTYFSPFSPCGLLPYEVKTLSKEQRRNNTDEKLIMKAQELQSKFIHSNVRCMKCNSNNIQGIRYKCSNCYDYDLCSDCHNMNNTHNPMHVFLKIRFPLVDNKNNNNMNDDDNKFKPRKLLYNRLLQGSMGNNFATELYGLTSYVLHLSLCDTMRSFKKLTDSKVQRNNTLQITLAIESQIGDEELLRNALIFYHNTAQILLKQIDTKNIYNDNDNDDNSKNEIFSAMPQYVLSDIIEYFSFTITKCYFLYDEEDFVEFTLTPVVNLLIYILCFPKLANKYHIRASILSCLLDFVCIRNPPYVSELVMNNTLFQQHIGRGLIQLYIEDGKFSRHANSFKDQTKCREEINTMFIQAYNDMNLSKCISSVPNNEKGIKLSLIFVNELIDHIGFLLNAMYIRLARLHELHGMMEMVPNAQSVFNMIEEAVRSSAAYVETNMFVLCDLLTHSMSFRLILIRNEIVDRVTQVLNEYITLFMNNEKEHLYVIGHIPKYVYLRMVMTACIHLSMIDRISKDEQEHGNTFIISFAKDVRGSQNNFLNDLVEFAKTSSVPLKDDLRFMRNDPIDDNHHEILCNQFNIFVAKVLQSIQYQAETDDLLGDDIPSEFLDPLMSEIMSDPVILPTSNVVIDRSVIERYLLKSATDPFNRQELHKDMLIPNNELRVKIEEFKKSKEEERKGC